MFVKESPNAMILEIIAFRLSLGSDLKKFAALARVVSQITNSRLNNNIEISEADNGSS